MSQKNEVLGHILWVLAFVAVFACLVAIAGCAHTNCGHPELSAEAGGVVLECGNTRSSEGTRYRSCLVLKANGQIVNIIYRGCPVMK